MNLLLDTHVAIWLTLDASRLTTAARTAITAPDSVVWFSLVTIWEAEIKRAKGSLELPDDMWPGLERRGYQELPLTRDHCLAAARLPLLHRDPFDRMLVAQAMTDGLTLVSADRSLAAYGLPILW